MLLLQVEAKELDLTVLLNLKCEEIEKIGTPIMAGTTENFKIDSKFIFVMEYIILV